MAWPLIIFNYNLPPEICFHTENILSLGVIPGPRKPVDADSFLIPLFMELDCLAEGVCAFSVLQSKIFSLHMHLILVFRDIPMVSMLMWMNGHNGVSPCCMCEITGLHIPNSYITTHYVPHHHLNYPNLSLDTAQVFNLAHLPLCHQQVLLARLMKSNLQL